MHPFAKAAILTGFIALAACNKTPAESAADNVEAAYDNSADALDAMAENSADALSNEADAMRAAGDNAADAIENGSVPANGM